MFFIINGFGPRRSLETGEFGKEIFSGCRKNPILAKLMAIELESAVLVDSCEKFRQH